jgi:hypothetical protein
LTGGIDGMTQFDGILALERMERAVWKVKDRLLRVTSALENAHVPYAVVGGNAVGAWIEQVDEKAVRATVDVDLAIRRDDLDAARAAAAKAGFVYRHVAGVDMFLDGPDATPRDAVHIIFSGEKVRQTYLEPVPDVSESESFTAFRVLSLEALLRMKLTSYWRKDQVHIQDLIGVGLIDESWLKRVPAALVPRLKELLDDPLG